MQFIPYYLACLAHGSYMIASDGEAAVIDPQRDVEQYLEDAKKLGAEIRWIIETHLHADFVSGHQELADRTGAKIVIGARANAEYPHHPVSEGDELKVGKVILRALETPGHTPESISWLVIDTEQSDKPVKVLTGDTLFIGDVGRPDLVGSKGFTAEQMSEMLYDSLHQKLLKLDDSVEVHPAHGAGSACGRNISKERSSTIGMQRKTNYALQPMPKEDFVKLMTTGMPEAPAYFSMDSEINRRGARPLEQIEAVPLAPEELKKKIERGAIVLDVRESGTFAAGHIPGSVNIGLKGQYASWAGSLLDPKREIVIVTEGRAEAEEAVMRLARVGLENAAGYLDGGVAAWHKAGYELQSNEQVSVDELKTRLESNGLQVLDVRNPGEYESGHVPGAKNVPLAHLQESLAKLDRRKPTAVVCQSGYRSSAAVSLLQGSGFDRLCDVVGGTAAWTQAGFAVEK